jgi:hypothetical protein
MTDCNFDEFEDGPVGRRGKNAHVSLNPRGYFLVNGKAILAMGEPDAVVLMFDSEKKIIGMKRSPIDRKNAFRLETCGRRTSGRMVYAGNFCRRHQITPTETIIFAAPEVNKDGVLMLDQNDAIPAKRL